VSVANVPVTAVVKTTKGYKFGGAIYAKPNCWSMLKGGLTADTTEVADLYFQVLSIDFPNCIFLSKGK
jgi:ABC-type enterochelin transport system substrate-binding protein